MFPVLFFHQHYEHKLKEMDMEVHRHEQEHERLLADLEKLEKQTEVAVQASVIYISCYGRCQAASYTIHQLSHRTGCLRDAMQCCSMLSCQAFSSFGFLLEKRLLCFALLSIKICCFFSLCGSTPRPQRLGSSHYYTI